MADGDGDEMQQTARAKSYTLDLLRAAAALSVLVFHWSPLGRKLGIHVPGAGAGALGVHLFFVLSGYLITSAVLSRSFTTRSYAINRAFRILPAYYASIVLVVLFRDSSVLSTWHGWKDLALHTVLLHTFSREFRTSINGVLWTLSIEWLFYIFMLVCAPLLRSHVWRWVLAGAMVVLPVLYRLYLWQTVDSNVDLNVWTKQLPGMLDHFGCGAVVALAVQHAAVRRLAARGAVRLVGLVLSGAVAAGCVLLYLRHRPEADRSSYWDLQAMVVLWPLVFCAAVAGVMLFLMQFETHLAPWIRRSGLGFVGVCSYSLYLLHAVIVGVMSRGFDPQTATVPRRLYALLALLLPIGAAVAGYFAVERPFMQLRVRFTGSRPAAAPEAPPPPEPASVSATSELASRPSQ